MAGERILVVEDNRKTAETLRLYLEDRGYEVSLAATGDEGLRLARLESPDLVLLDLMLPKVSGLTLCRTLRTEVDTPIIIVTARTSEEDRLRGLEHGADDYVSKPFSPREVVARVAAVLRRAGRTREASGSRRRVGELRLDGAGHEARIGANSLGLTAAEFRLLDALADAPGRVFSRPELAGKVFADGSEAMERTIDAHVMKVRRKIRRADPAGRIQIETVFGAGYRLIRGVDAP